MYARLLEPPRHTWDIILIDVDHAPDEPLDSASSAFYTAEGLRAAAEHLRSGGVLAVWSTDPMHGNTTSTDEGFKTRHFSHILSEIQQAFEIHAAASNPLGGVHLELTGEDVTECTGGAQGLEASTLLAQRAEEWGFRRIWYAEHHNMGSIASAATSGPMT